MKALCARFDKESHFLGRLTKLRQIGSIDEFIVAFEYFVIWTEDLSYAFYTKCFISGRKDAIHAHVCMQRPTNWLEA